MLMLRVVNSNKMIELLLSKYDTSPLIQTKSIKSPKILAMFNSHFISSLKRIDYYHYIYFFYSFFMCLCKSERKFVRVKLYSFIDESFNSTIHQYQYGLIVFLPFKMNMNVTHS